MFSKKLGHAVSNNDTKLLVSNNVTKKSVKSSEIKLIIFAEIAFVINEEYFTWNVPYLYIS